jgi:hypothetical protein
MPMHEQALKACHPFDGGDALASGVIRRKWGAGAAVTFTRFVREVGYD